MAAKVASGVAGLAGRLVQGAVKVSKPRLQTAWQYFKVEVTPPGPSQWGQVVKELNEIVKFTVTGKFMQLTTKEAAVNGCIAAEIAFWFFAGEVIGRRNLIGYKIPGAYV